MSKPLRVDDLPVVTTPHVRESQAPVESPRVEKLIALLTPCVPPLGNRHGFYLAVTGFFAKQLLPAAEAKAVVIALCLSTGSHDKIAERLALTDTTYAKYDAGQDVAGAESLRESLTHAVGNAAGVIVEQLTEAITPLRGEPKQEDSQETQEDYTRQRPLDGKLDKRCLTQIQNDLQTHPDWQGVIAYDTFLGRIVARRKPPTHLDAESSGWSDDDTTAVQSWFQIKQQANAAREDLDHAIPYVAKQNKFNSVADWLDSLPTATGAIDELADVLGLALPIERVMLRKWILSAVARAYQPGIFVKAALCMQGEQNAGKSNLLKRLFGEDKWASINGDLSDDRRVGGIVRGKWIVEIEEAHAVKKTDKDALKRFISLNVDEYRAAYAHYEVRRDRTCVIAITTNSDEFLDDDTGNVRYYCVRTGDRIDLDRITAIREQVWAEARDAFKAGEPIYLTNTTDERAAADRAREYEISDPLEEWVAEHLAGKVVVTVRELIGIATDFTKSADALALQAARDRFADKRFAKALRRIGCKRKRTAKGNVWVVPEKYRERTDGNIAYTN